MNDRNMYSFRSVQDTLKRKKIADHLDSYLESLIIEKDINKAKDVRELNKRQINIHMLREISISAYQPIF